MYAQWWCRQHCAFVQCDTNLHWAHFGRQGCIFCMWTAKTPIRLCGCTNWFESKLDTLVRRYITKTCLYNFDPLKPHFYIVKLGFTGVYIIFLVLLVNIDCGYSLELPRRGGSNEYPQSMFWAKIWKISEFFIWKCSVFDCIIFNIFE